MIFKIQAASHALCPYFMNQDVTTQSMDPTTAIGIKVGVEVLKRSAPYGIDWIATYTCGIELLIIGPSGAGKTSIADYLQFGTLEDLHTHQKTLEIQKSRTFKIELGRDQTLKLRVRRTVDVPGQTGPEEHANLVRVLRPHAILIVFDASTPAKEYKDWIVPFCERLDYLIRENGAIKKKIKGFFVALNKRDLVRTDRDFLARQKAVKKALLNGLSDVFGRQTASRIPVLPTISINSNLETKLLDALTRQIAKQVAK